MKVRTGFVSNSSSSSFLIWGISKSSSELRSLLTIEEDDEVYEKLEDCLSKTGLDYYHPEYDDTYYIGVSWSSVKDDETGAQFKARVQQLIAQLLGADLPCSTHEEAWRDG